MIRGKTGLFADIPPIICAGTVLSQPMVLINNTVYGRLRHHFLPPIMIQASTGCARIISSVSMLIKLRRNMLVGAEKLSATLMVGKSIANPPASCTPLLAASMSCGVLPWPMLRFSVCSSLGHEENCRTRVEATVSVDDTNDWTR